MGKIFSTLDECKQAWEKAGGHGEKQDRIARNIRWLAYYGYLAKKQENAEAYLNPVAEEAVEFLAAQQVLTTKSTVIDIGSGTGGYSLAFAKHCAYVTAMDMDEASLRVLTKNAKQLGINNISTTEAMWENYTDDKKYSVAFSSMCPAICNYQELLKMEALAEESCCLVAVSRGSFDLHRKKLMELLAVKPVGGMTTEAIWYMNMLYLMGRNPGIKSRTDCYEYQLPIEEICTRNEVYFEIFGIPASRSGPVLRKYFDGVAEKGMVSDESHLNTALIYWKPDDQR